MVESVTSEASNRAEVERRLRDYTPPFMTYYRSVNRLMTTTPRITTKRPETPQERRNDSNPYPSMDKSG